MFTMKCLKKSLILVVLSKFILQLLWQKNKFFFAISSLIPILVKYFFNKAANECSPLIGIFIEKPFECLKIILYLVPSHSHWPSSSSHSSSSEWLFDSVITTEICDLSTTPASAKVNVEGIALSFEINLQFLN